MSGLVNYHCIVARRYRVFTPWVFTPFPQAF